MIIITTVEVETICDYKFGFMDECCVSTQKSCLFNYVITLSVQYR